MVFESIENKRLLWDSINQHRASSEEYALHLSKREQAELATHASNWNVDFKKLSAIEIYIQLQADYTRKVCGTMKPEDTFGHFDDYMQHLSESLNKKIVGLEPYSAQIKIMNEMTDGWEDAKKIIQATLRNMRRNKSNTVACRIANDYRKFRFNYELSAECTMPNLAERNAGWMPTITKCLEEDKTTIVVGLLHLYGACGLITSLRREDYTVEPVVIPKRH